MSESEKRAIIPFRYALFAERQYQAVSASDEAEKLRRDVETKTREVTELEQMLQSQSRSAQKSGSFHKLTQERRRAGLMLDQDSQKYQLHVQKIDVFLRDSIKMFAECLCLSDEHDTDVITRLCSLWFQNFQEHQIQAYIAEAIQSIPSRKFVFFAHQLSALLSTADTSSASATQSARALHDLLLRLCREHPFHSLYQVHALWKGDGKESTSSSERPDARRQASSNILNQLRGKSLEGIRLRKIEMICEAYLQWALYEIPPPDHGSQATAILPRSVKLSDLKAPDIPIPTAALAVDPACKYENIIGIGRYSSRYRTSGGVNLPKIIDCWGTDGQKHIQVVRSQAREGILLFISSLSV
jgi:ataxia telangiectasia mutated family protein